MTQSTDGRDLYRDVGTADAIRMATLRRHLRDSGLGPLEPIHSLAYCRTVIDQMDPLALDPGYIEYIAWKYDGYFVGKQLAPEHVQSAAKKPRYGVS